MMSTKIKMRASLYAACMMLYACLFTHSAQAQGGTPLRVVASFSILADMVREVGGEDVSVSSLVGPNADAHVFEPSPSDVRQVAQARLVIINGLHFEGWMERLIKSSGYRGTLVVASRGIAPRQLGGEPDPHAWQSLTNAHLYVENIRAALAAALPAKAQQIERRTAAYLQRIDALDRTVRKRFAAIPAAQRRVVTAHDAFGYFGAAYGVEFIAPQGWTTESEASAADVARIVRQIRAQRAQALFAENISDPRLLQRIAQESGAKVGGKLYSDALSPPGTEADTYLKLFEHNAATLAAALAATLR